MRWRRPVRTRWAIAWRVSPASRSCVRCTTPGGSDDRDGPVGPSPACATLVDKARGVNYRCAMAPPAVDLPAPESPADGLAAVVALRRLADRLEQAQVERALADGWTWAQ